MAKINKLYCKERLRTGFGSHHHSSIFKYKNEGEAWAGEINEFESGVCTGCSVLVYIIQRCYTAKLRDVKICRDLQKYQKLSLASGLFI